MNPTKKTKQAFTLMEVLIAMAVFAIVTSGVITILITTADFYDATTLSMDLSSRGRLVLREMIQNLKKSPYQAVSVSTNTPTQYIIRYKRTTGWNINNTPPVDSVLSFYTLDRATKTLTWGTSTAASKRVISRIVAGIALAKDNPATKLGVTFVTGSRRVLLTVTLSRQYSRRTQLDWRTQVFHETMYLMSVPRK